LKNHLQDDVAEPSGLMAVFENRKIADNNLSAMGRIFGSEGAFAPAEHAIQRIKQELIRHSSPGHFQRGARAFIERRPLAENKLRREFEIAPLVGR
jgi:hypothetical protein